MFWPFVATLVTTIGGTDSPALALRDMAVPPSMALNELATGQDGLPRAIPQDTVLAFLSPVIPPPVTVSVIMLACGYAGAFGAATLARSVSPSRSSTASRVVPFLAAAITLWNPFVAERLLQGHWSVVAAGTLLPAIALFAGWGTRRRVALLIPLFLVCALTPTGLILAVVTALVASIVSGPGRRGIRAAGIGIGGVVLSLPWVLPTLMNTGASASLSDAAGADLFAARAEPWVGTVGALAGLGGIWNAGAVPESRDWLAPVSTVAGVILALIALAVAVLLARRGRLSGAPLAWLALGAIVVPALMASSPGLTVTGWMIENLPGAGLIRDAQKFVVLAVPGLVVLLAQLPKAVDRADTEVGNGTGSRTSTVGILTAAVLVWAGVPALPGDVADVRPVSLDARYQQVTDEVEKWAESTESAESGSPRTLLWPPGNYRMVEGRPALDPLLKMLPGAPVDPGYLIVDGQLVDGDADTVQLLSELGAGEDTLADNDVDLVVAHDDGEDEENEAAQNVLAEHELVWEDDGWQIFAVR